MALQRGRGGAAFPARPGSQRLANFGLPAPAPDDAPLSEPAAPAATTRVSAADPVSGSDKPSPSRCFGQRPVDPFGCLRWPPVAGSAPCYWPQPRPTTIAAFASIAAGSAGPIAARLGKSTSL